LIKVETMNDYEVTFTNGEVVMIAAPTPEEAQAIAETNAPRYGCQGLSAVSIEPLISMPLGLA
jgi:predicted NAD/FAD-dependent oxidoreductase